MVYPKTREKIQTRIFGLGSGQVSLNKISGFSGLTSENPKNSGRVSSIYGFLTLYCDFTKEIGIFQQKKRAYNGGNTNQSA